MSVGISGPMSLPRGGVGGMWDGEEVDAHSPLLLTASGSHHTYGRKAGGMHPTGMLSCRGL